MSKTPASVMLGGVRLDQLQRIREFVLAVEAATASGTTQRAQRARLARSFHRLSPDVRDMVAAGYRSLLIASERGGEHRAEAARHQVLANLIRGTGLTREQILATPAPESGLRAEHWQPDTTSLDLVVPRVRRADSEPDPRPVATAAPVLDDDPGPGWAESARLSPPRTRVRLAVAATALAAVACLGFLAWSWYATPLTRLAAPEPRALKFIPINRVIEFDGGAMLFSHGQSDGETTWLEAYEFNFGDEARPAVELSIDVAVGVDGVERAGRDIDVAKRVPEISGSNARIPPKAVRRRVIPVRGRSDKDTMMIKLHGETQLESVEPVHILPLR